MPLIRGYSKGSISKNIETLMKEGYRKNMAIAIALQRARAAWKKRHAGEVMPSYLKDENNPKRKKRHVRGYVVKRVTPSNKIYYFDGIDYTEKVGYSAIYLDKNIADTIALNVSKHYPNNKIFLVEK